MIGAGVFKMGSASVARALLACSSFITATPTAPKQEVEVQAENSLAAYYQGMKEEYQERKREGIRPGVITTVGVRINAGTHETLLKMARDVGVDLPTLAGRLLTAAIEQIPNRPR